MRTIKFEFVELIGFCNADRKKEKNDTEIKKTTEKKRQTERTDLRREMMDS